MNNELTCDELDTAIDDINKQIQNKQTLLNDITSGASKLLTQSDINTIQLQYNKYYLEWKRRRKIYNDLIGAISESMDKKQMAKMIVCII